MTANEEPPRLSFVERVQRALRTTYIQLFVSYLLIFIFISGLPAVFSRNGRPMR